MIKVYLVTLQYTVTRTVEVITQLDLTDEQAAEFAMQKDVEINNVTPSHISAQRKLLAASECVVKGVALETAARGLE